jgi:hypothetical protein
LSRFLKKSIYGVIGKSPPYGVAKKYASVVDLPLPCIWSFFKNLLGNSSTE